MNPRDKRGRVLVVEDDPDYAELLRMTIARFGYDADVALHGEAVLPMLAWAPPDVITLDLELPARSGLLLYRQLKSNPRLRHIPVVVVTGLSPDNAVARTFIRRFVESGRFPPPEAYIQKPVDETALGDTLRRLVSVPLQTNNHLFLA